MSSSTATPFIPSQAMNIGGFPAAYLDSFTLVNLFRGAQGWQSSADQSYIPRQYLDERGWVKDIPPLPEGEFVLANVFYTKEMPAGKFIIEWEGKGQVLPWQNYKVISPNKIEFQYDANYANGDDGITLRIASSDPNNTGDYVRNIKLYREEHTDLIAMGESFNPLWMDRIDDFQVLRTHGMQDTNFTTTKDYDLQVETKDQAFWGPSGKSVPLEALVEISNSTKADLWITIPHLATNDYMEKVARYLEQNLDPKLKVYVEYSNEYWTQGFFQNQYFIDKGQQLFGDADFAAGQAYGARVAEMTKIFKGVFQFEPDRLVPTLTLDDVMFSTGEAAAVLNTPDWVAKGGISPLQAGIKFVATDGYFGWFNTEPYFDRIVDGFIAQGDKKFEAARDFLINEIKTSLAANWTKARELLDPLGLKFGVYEGGALLINGSFSDNNGPPIDPKYTEFNKAFQLSPEMKQVYEFAIAEWNKIGNGPFAWFADTGRANDVGDYGLWNGVNYTPEPRTNAIVDANGVPTPWDAASGRNPADFANGKYALGTTGNDSMTGTKLNDRLYGSMGNDVLNGKAGDDTLVGGVGNDTLSGGAGNDLLVGGAGADKVQGGAGIDTASFQTSSKSVAVDLLEGKGTRGDALGDVYSGIENLIGGTASDVLRGDVNSNWLQGGAGNDVLMGRAGNDRLNGGNGNDTLYGGSGSDIFYFGLGNDVIMDWREGDKLVVETSSGGFGDPGRVKISQVGADTQLMLDGKSLTLMNTQASTISITDDFLFS